MVFVHATGDTHALSAEASAVLAAMRSHPGQAHATPEWLRIAGCTAEAGPGAPDDSLMPGLAAIGLVRRSPS